eukprot:14389760-Alexandrium_andersonii.AAC.1
MAASGFLSAVTAAVRAFEVEPAEPDDGEPVPADGDLMVARGLCIPLGRALLAAARSRTPGHVTYSLSGCLRHEFRSVGISWAGPDSDLCDTECAAL